MKIENFNKSNFDSYAAYLKSTGLSDASLKRKLSSLANFQKYLVKKNLIQNLPDSNPIPTLSLDRARENENKNFNPHPAMGRVKKIFPSLREGLGVGLQNFQNKKLFSYLLLASLLIISSAIGYGFYRQSVKDAKSGFAYSTASSPVYANRFLSFQGRLTDSVGNPITSSVSIQFDLFNTETVGTGTSLYTSATGNSQVVTPDENGIFSVTIGKTHGTEIPNSVFTENPAVYLQITAGSETMSPRQPIATVAYAINAETLQGLPPSASGLKNTVLTIGASGNINLGETSPSIISTSGTLGIEGQAVLIKASDSSGGNIEINPDANGIIKLTTEGSGSTAVNGFIDATNANLATGNLYSATIRNDNRGYNFLDFRNYDTSTTNLATRFSVDAYGNTFIGGTLSPTTISIGNTLLTSNGYELNLLDGTLATAGSLIYGNGSNLVNTSVGTSGQLLMSNASGAPVWINAASAGIGTTYAATNGLTLSSNTFKLGGALTENTRLNIGNTEVFYVQYSTGNVGIGTSSPSQKLDVNGKIAINGVQTIYNAGAIDSNFTGSLFIGNGGVSLSHTTGAEGYYNTGVGIGSLYSNTTGYNNSAQGVYTLYTNTTGSQNSAQGYDALFSNTTGSSNSAQGYQALFYNTTGNYNVAQGYAALYNNTIGNNNSAQGSNTLFYSKTGSNGVAVGFESQRYIVGVGTLGSGDTTAWTNYNTSIGYQALRGNSAVGSTNTGNYNTSIGYQSLLNNTTGANNSAQGAGALVSNTTGNANSAQGYNTLYSNTTGSQNTAQGYAALYTLTSSSNNTAMGINAGRYYNGTTGNLTSANNSLFLGASASALANGGTNEIVIGYNAIGNGSNSATLGNNSITKTILKGNVGIGTTDTSQKLTIEGNIKMGSQTDGYARLLIDNYPYQSTPMVALNAVSRDSDSRSELDFGGGTVAGYAATLVKFFTGTTRTTTTGTERMRIDSSGNVGINNASPTHKLDVIGDGSFSTNLNVGGTLTLPQGASNGYILQSDASGNAHWTSASGIGGTDTLSAGTDISITSAGVGRTISNTSTLSSVTGRGASTSTMLNLLGGAYFGSTNQSILKNDGKIGIGLTNPSQALDVNGKIAINGSQTIYNASAYGGFAGSLFVGTGGNSLSHSTGAEGWYNTGIGLDALTLNTTGSSNAAFGTSSLAKNTTGGGNLAIGTGSLSNNTTGSYNTAIGTNAFNQNLAGSNGIAIGNESQRYLVGVGTLGSGDTTAWTNYNTSIGYQALRGNSAVGSTNTGNYNTAIGYQALISNTTGRNNTAQGYVALSNNTTGTSNTAQGYAALLNLTGSYSNNTALGVSAGRYYNGTTGNLTSTNNSLFLGASASALTNGGDNEIVIGYNAIGNGSNSATLGNDSITKTILKGNVGIGTTNPLQKLDVVGNINASGNLSLGANFVISNESGSWWQRIRTVDNATLTDPAFNFEVRKGSGDYINLMAITNGGNVGIGTTNPTSKLHVVGNGNITGNLTIGGTFVSVGSTNLVTNLNADLLDGQHSTYYLNIGQTGSLPYVNNATNNTLTRSGSGPYTLGLNLASVNTWTGSQTFGRAYQAANGIPTSNLGTPSITEMALFQEEFNNKTSFYNINNLKFYTYNGTDWSEYTSSSDTDKRKFLGGDSDSGIIIPNQTQKFRIELTNSGSYVFLNALYMYWSSNSHSSQVQIWKRDYATQTWTQVTSSTATVTDWPGHLYLPFSTIPFSSSSNNDAIRIEFTPTWSTGTYSTRDINLYRMQIWGGYPSGKRTIYATDEYQNVTFPKNISTGTTLTANTVNFTQSQSTTKVTNLNADLLDGLDSSAFLQIGTSANFISSLTAGNGIDITGTGVGRTITNTGIINATNGTLTRSGSAGSYTLGLNLGNANTWTALQNLSAGTTISTLSTTGNASIGGTLAVTGRSTFSNNLSVGGTLTLPQGANDGYVLTSDASGNAYWALSTGGVGSTYAAGVGLTLSSGNIFSVDYDTTKLSLTGNKLTLNLGSTNTWTGTQTFGTATYLTDYGAAGSINLRVGDDSYLTDVDAANTLGIYGGQSTAVASIRLGSNSSSTISGHNGYIGIGTTTPTHKLEVVGNGSFSTSLSVGTTLTIATLKATNAQDTTVVTNLNADLLDGQHSTYYLNIGQTGSLPYVNNTTDTTLTRSGTGPYTLGLNLANANTWTTLQTFTNGIGVSGSQTLTSTDSNVIHYKNLASYNNSVSSITGTLKITMPKSWSNTMGITTIKGYDYSSSDDWEIVVSGYNYQPTPAWSNYSASINGDAPFNQVRLAYDVGTSQNVILIGTTATVWSYPKAIVTDFIAGHSNITGWGSGWAITIITDESNITSSVTPTIQTYLSTSGNFGINTVSPTQKLTVVGDGSFSTSLSVGTSLTVGSNLSVGGTLAVTGKSVFTAGFDSNAASTISSLTLDGNSGTALNISGTSFTTDINLQNSETIDNDTDGRINFSSSNLSLGGTTFLTSGRLLQVANGTVSAPSVSFSADTNTGMYRGGTDILGFTTAGADRLSILANGNVGIGTTAPSHKLEVVGDGYFSTNLSIGGTFLSVGSTNLVSNLNADLLDGYHASQILQNSVYYVEGNTTGTAGVWTGSITGLDSYYDGLTIAYKIGIAGNSTTTLDINGLGAVVARRDTGNLTTHLPVDTVVLLTYTTISGTPYWVWADYDSNTYDRTYWNNTITAGTAIYDYKLLMQANDGKWYPLTLETGTGTSKTISTQEFTINSPILFYYSTTDIAANGTTGNVYSEIPTGYLSYTANQTSWTDQLPIYLKGTINSSGNFVLDNTTSTSFMTQTLPTTDDGFVYILLGQMYSTTYMRLYQYHPMYQYKFGKVQLYNSTSDLFVLKTGDTISGNLNIGGTLTLPQGAGAGKILQSDASGNASWITASGVGGTDVWSAGGGISITSVGVGRTITNTGIINATNGTLTRSGSAGSYTLGLNLGNANTWTSLQTFTNGIGVSSTATFTNSVNIGGSLAVTGTLDAPTINTGYGDYEVNSIAGYYGNQNLRTTDSPTFAGLTLNGNLALGSNTLTTSNTGLVSNLNADLLDGQHSTYFINIGQTGSLPYVNNTTDTTLTRSGTGPYTLGLNLANANTWTATQTFTTNLVLNNSAADGAGLVLKSSGYSDWNIDNYFGSLRLYYGSTENFRFYNNGGLSIGQGYAAITAPANGAIIQGNVGIGTTNPTSTLTVVGNGSISTNLSVGSTLSVTGKSVFTAGFDSNAASTISSLTLDGNSGTALNISGTSFTTDINLQNGETIDNDTDGRINFSSSNLSLAGTTFLTSGRLFQSANGTVGGPAYSFSSDTNSGMYSGGADILRFSTAGVDRLTINASGNIGIGTTSPLAPLEIGTTASTSVGGQTLSSLSGLFTGSLAAPRYYDSDNSLYYSDPATNDVNYSSVNLAVQGSIKWNINSGNLPNTYIGAYAASRIQGFTNGLSLDVGTTASIGVGSSVVWNNNLFLSANGNVGIGTTAPSEKLDVAGNIKTNNTIKLYNSTTQVGEITTSDTTWLRINQNVAKNIYTPQYFRADGGLYVDSTSYGINGSGILLNASLSGTYSNALTLSNTSNSYTGADISISGNSYFATSSGNVGIGTTNPTNKLEISGGSMSLHNTDFVAGTTGSGFYINMGATSGNTYTQLVPFTTGNTAYGNFVIPGGNVGIGTTNPTHILNIAGADSSDANNVTTGSQMAMESPTASHGLYFRTKGASAGISGSNYANQIFSSGGSGLELYTSGTLTFGSAYTERMRINSSGNVGIGTTNPNYKLEITGDAALVSNATGVSLTIGGKSGTAWPYTFDTKTGPFLQIKSGYSSSAPLVITDVGSVGIGTTSPLVQLHVNYNVLIGGNSGSRSTGYVYDALNVNYSGGGTQFGAEFVPGADNTYPIVFTNASNGGVGSIYTTSSGTTYNTTSDRRLKENIVDTSLGLEALNKLSVKDFNFISDPDKSTTQGFIAQELYQVYPYAVTVGGDNPVTSPWGVDYGRMTPLIVKSVQELDSKISDLSVTSTGQINIGYNVSPEVLASLGYVDSKNEIESATYNLTDSLGKTVTRISQFAQIAAAKIKAGLISTTNLIADNAAIKNLKSNKITTDDIISPVGNIAHLTSQDIQTTTVTTDNLVAQDIQATQVTTDLADVNLLKAANLTASEASVSSLVAENIQAEELEADKLTANEASVSTLYADQIISKEGSFADIMANKISSLRDELTNIVAKDEESTPSAIALESDNWSITVATDSAKISGNLALTDNLVIGAQLLVNGDAQFGNAFVTGQFTAGEVSIASNYIETTNTALFIQPSNTGSVHIMGETLVIADTGEVKINGNLTVTGSVFASLLEANEIKTQKLTAAEINSDKINIATDSGTILGTTDTNIATDSASMIIADNNNINIATNSAQVNSNATAGTATLPAGITELVISTTKLSANSMVYLTPVGSTNNQVLYVKEKTTDHFTVAIESSLDHDISINWWIIN